MVKIHTGWKKFYTGEWLFALKNMCSPAEVTQRVLKASKGFLVPLEAELFPRETYAIINLRTSKTPIEELANKIKEENSEAINIYAGINIPLTKTKSIFYDENISIYKEEKYFPFEIQISYHKRKTSEEEILLSIRSKINIFLPKVTADPKANFGNASLYTVSNKKLSKISIICLNNLLKKIKTEFSKDIIDELEPEPSPAPQVAKAIGYKVTKDGIYLNKVI